MEAEARETTCSRARLISDALLLGPTRKTRPWSGSEYAFAASAKAKKDVLLHTYNQGTLAQHKLWCLVASKENSDSKTTGRKVRSQPAPNSRATNSNLNSPFPDAISGGGQIDGRCRRYF